MTNSEHELEFTFAKNRDKTDAKSVIRQSLNAEAVFTRLKQAVAEGEGERQGQRRKKSVSRKFVKDEIKAQLSSLSLGQLLCENYQQTYPVEQKTQTSSFYV